MRIVSWLVPPNPFAVSIFTSCFSTIPLIWIPQSKVHQLISSWQGRSVFCQCFILRLTLHMLHNMHGACIKTPNTDKRESAFNSHPILEEINRHKYYQIPISLSLTHFHFPFLFLRQLKQRLSNHQINLTQDTTQPLVLLSHNKKAKSIKKMIFLRPTNKTKLSVIIYACYSVISFYWLWRILR